MPGPINNRGIAWKTVSAWCLENQAAILLLLALALFTSKSLYNIPFGIMAILGLYRACRWPAAVLTDPGIRRHGLLIACLWLPMLAAFVDPVNLQRSAWTVWPYLRFFLAGVYILSEIRRRDFHSVLETGFFIIVSFWALDGVLQFLIGRDIFGFPYYGEHITGVFYPEATIGHVLAGVAALYLESVRRRASQRPWVWMMIIPLFVVVLLSGRRSVWFMLGLNILGFVLYHLYLSWSDKRRVLKMASVGMVTAAVLLSVILTQESVQQRIDKTMLLFSADIQKIDRATSERLHPWVTAWRIFRDNPVNGIGPRGFRYVYQDYADPDFNFYEDGMTHPHLVILEIAAETGVIGVLGYGGFLAMLIGVAWRYRNDAAVSAGCIGALAGSFPINSHVAFYGSYWSSILWWIILFTLLTITLPQHPADAGQT